MENAGPENDRPNREAEKKATEHCSRESRQLFVRSAFQAVFFAVHHFPPVLHFFVAPDQPPLSKKHPVFAPVLEAGAAAAERVREAPPN